MQQSIAMTVPEHSDLDANTASIIVNEAPWIPTNNILTKPDRAAIEAHRQFFSVVFHQSSSISERLAEAPLKSVNHLVSVADAYQSLHLVAVPIDNHMILNLLPDVTRFCSNHPRELLHLAISLRPKWLHKEVECRLIGDSNKSHIKITQMFNRCGIAALIV